MAPNGLGLGKRRVTMLGGCPSSAASTVSAPHSLASHRPKTLPLLIAAKWIVANM